MTKDSARNISDAIVHTINLSKQLGIIEKKMTSTLVAMSFIKMKKKRGPRIEPCGIPDAREKDFDL